MNTSALRSLTWLTVTAAIAGALMLAMSESGLEVFRSQRSVAREAGTPLQPAGPSSANKRPLDARTSEVRAVQ